MSACCFCIADRDTIISINSLLVELYNERVQLYNVIESNQTKFKSERLTKKQQEILNVALPKMHNNTIITDYLAKKKDFLLEKFIHPKSLCEN